MKLSVAQKAKEQKIEGIKTAISDMLSAANSTWHVARDRLDDAHLERIKAENSLNEYRRRARGYIDDQERADFLAPATEKYNDALDRERNCAAALADTDERVNAIRADLGPAERLAVALRRYSGLTDEGRPGYTVPGSLGKGLSTEPRLSADEARQQFLSGIKGS